MARRRELDAAALAAAMAVPRPTVVLWLRLWDAMGVPGIRRERARGRHGYAYRVTAALLTRWRRGDLPAPRSTERFAAAVATADTIVARVEPPAALAA